jgi:hypothetical protein
LPICELGSWAKVAVWEFDDLAKARSSSKALFWKVGFLDLGNYSSCPKSSFGVLRARVICQIEK